MTDQELPRWAGVWAGILCAVVAFALGFFFATGALLAVETYGALKVNASIHLQVSE